MADSKNLDRRVEDAKKECESKIKKLLNSIVLAEPFVRGDIIYVAAVTKMIVYKAHLYAIQYTPIAAESNFASPIRKIYDTYTQLGNEEFYKTEMIEVVSETFAKELPALQKFAEYQTQPPNAEVKFSEMYNSHTMENFVSKLLETISKISEETPRHEVIRAGKIYPPIVIRKGNASTWTHNDFEQMILFLCEANAIECVQNREYSSNQQNLPDIWLKIPTNNVQKEISHQKALCMRIWGGDFLWIVKEHLYSEGYHMETHTRLVKKTSTDSNGVRHEREIQVNDETKHEEVNFEHLFIGQLVQAQAPLVPLQQVSRAATLEAVVLELFQFFRKREFAPLFRVDRSPFIQGFKHKMHSAAHIENAQLDSVFAVGSILCPKLGKFYHPGAVYLGKGQVGHGPLWTTDAHGFRIEAFEDFIGPVTGLAEIRWRFNPATPDEIQRRAQSFQSSDLRSATLDELDRLVFRCAMDLNECSNLNDWIIETFNLFRQRNFTEVFKKAANCLVKIVDHDLSREQKISDSRLDQLFHFGSVLCAKRSLGGIITPYAHAGVYLGNGRVIHAQPKNENELRVPSKIFRNTDFAQFSGESNKVKEYRWRYSPFTRDEVIQKTRLMSEAKYLYNLHEQNCEHLAFKLAMNIDFSPQMSSRIKRAGASLIAPFLTFGMRPPDPVATPSDNSSAPFAAPNNNECNPAPNLPTHSQSEC